VRIKIIDKSSNELEALIDVADDKDLMQISKKWNFDWKSMIGEDASFFKLTYQTEIQGLVKLAFENNEYLVLKNIEVHPSNYGSCLLT